MKRYDLSIIIVLLLISLAGAQSDHGSDMYRTRNDHSGNLIRVTFYNHGMLGGVKGDNSLKYPGEWPINSGMIQMGNASSFVSSRLRVLAEVDNEGDSIYTYITPCVFCQGWDPVKFSHDSLGRFQGFEPLPGYYSIAQKEKDPLHAVAMSHQAFTWPPNWPDKMDDPIDPGWSAHWNGYFGKNQKNADQESYYVLDDYPFDKKVSGYDLPKPLPTDPNRGGLGLIQKIRGLQWSNPDAEDCIFWIYSIENFGEINHNQTIFGLNVGASIGALLTGNNDYSDDCATFYRETDLTVNYDWDNVGTQGYSPVPWAGFAFLESPGNPYDGIDNDGDGLEAIGGGHVISTSDFVSSYSVGNNIVLIDYESYERTLSTMPAEGIRFTFNGTTYRKMPNTPLEEIPRNSVDDNLNGLIDESDGAMAPDSVTYYLYIQDPVYNDQEYLAKDYLTGVGLLNLMIDERRDDGIDNDGDWNSDYDDVGLDGKPGTGDYGEGDGFPTPAQGDLPGEPNIDITDVNESDQIGLTSFIFYEYGAITYSNDEDMWDVSRPGFFDGHLENVDADYIFTCGYFPLRSQQNEFFSVAMIYGWDEQDILRNKDIVQKIYDSNYNFAVAPDKPTLTAVAGDGRVTLYWDSKAEESFDRYLKEYDFEGYKIYRATDVQFSDAGSITDGYGYDTYTKPLAVFDKIDSVFDFFPKSSNGIQFFLGNETGLVHQFIDSSAINGIRYFYAVTAYDKGNVDQNIYPSETNKFVTLDATGEITTDINVVVATPTAPSLGYIPPEFETQPRYVGSGITAGGVWVRYLNPDFMKDNTEYEVQFLDQTMDRADNDLDSLTDEEDIDEWLPTLTTGFVLKNLTEQQVIDTVWFFDYRLQGDSLVQIKNLYENNDGNTRTLSALTNGMEFFIYNPSPSIIDDPDNHIHHGIRWSENINYESAYPINFGIFNLGGFLPGISYPRQYQIIFYDEIIGQSEYVYPILASTGTTIPIPPRNVNFRIIDQQTGEDVHFGYVDYTSTADEVTPGFFSARDRIIFFENLPDSSSVITFQALNNAVQDTTFINNYGRILGGGDTLNLFPDFPFTSNSKYHFKTEGQKINRQTAKTEMDKITVVPNPYVVTAAWEPKNPYSNGRGDRSIKFMNLPQRCTIRIFAIDGTLIEKLTHNSSMLTGYEDWDMLSKDGMEISYGIYIYHIEAPGVGEKVGKIIIIK